MEYEHSVEQSEEYARNAMALMALHKIVPHPNNFTVWYCHCSGEWPDLSRTLNLLLQPGQRLSDERSLAVYKSFCASPFDALPLPLIAARIETQVAQILGALERASAGADAYGEKLERAASEFAAEEKETVVRRIVGQLLTETRAMAAQSHAVERQLQASVQEIGSLKTELEGARREALSDSLTTLANRRMFEFVLRDAAVAAVEDGTPLSLMMLDVDHFKKFNDDYGHAVGDHVLKLLARALLDNVKGQDTPARYGGEEFAIILPRTRACDARKLADSIRQIIAGKSLVNRKTGEPVSRITVSIGVAEFNYGENLSQFVDRTDQALLMAKRTGRNRVILDVAGSPRMPVAS